MSINNLKPALGSVQKKGKRLGRGQGSGKGGSGIYLLNRMYTNRTLMNQ